MRTAEFVSPKHPDKICDRISDAILDEALRQDPDSRVAIEVMGGHGIVTVTGEMTTKAFVDIKKIVNRIAPGVGVQINIEKQSPEIARGVNNGGAGDQGIVIGYATRETENFMPLEYEYAREICKLVYKIWKSDGKTQVTINDKDEITNIIVSFQGVMGSENDLIAILITSWKERNDIKLAKDFELFINPGGDWEQGGFDADTGLTGRKIVVDSYGPRVQVGGGAFSGKDPSKIDRSGAYMARKIAVNILKENKKYKEVMVELAYSIGIENPVAVTAYARNNTGRIKRAYDLSPRGIIKALDLRKPIYEATAEWGHFGNGFAWDK